MNFSLILVTTKVMDPCRGTVDSNFNTQILDNTLIVKRQSMRQYFKGLIALCMFILISYLSFVNYSSSWVDSLPLKEIYHKWTNGSLHATNRLFIRINQSEAVSTTNAPPVTTPKTTTMTTHEEVETTTASYSINIAYPRNFNFIMDETEACRNNTPFLVLMVPVRPCDIAARDAIRKTWGNETLVQGHFVLTLFLVGLTGGEDAAKQQEMLQQESQLHHDLIQSDFMDTYLNLTTKTMVIMDWLATRCPNASYAMKVDSDMFLNIHNLVAMLLMPDTPKVNYLTGMLMWERPVVRSKNSKWYVPEELYPEPLYPTYALGMGYVFSNDLPEKMVNVSKDIRPFNIEDAYVGLCMKRLGLQLTGPPNPSQFKAYLQAYNRCEFSQIITYILGSSAQLVEFWMDLHKPDPPCPH